jgi:Flp pilus assembly protein TadG
MIHRPFKKKHRAANFFSNREGAVSIIFGLTIILLIVLIGGVIDFGMAMVSRTQSQAATDAAALAIATPISGADPSALGRRYFETNYPFATSGVSRTYNDISVDIRPDQVTVESVANMRTGWLNAGGIDEVGVNALTVVSRNRIPVPPDLDMVLVLDTSGSMLCGIDQDSVRFNLPNSCYPYTSDVPWAPLPTGAPIRKDQMLPAAKDLVSRIMGAGSPVIRMGLVSYSSQTKQAFGLDNDANNLRNRIDGVDFAGSTCGACGMNTAREILTSSSPAPVTGRPDGRPLSEVRHVVFLTDGEQNCRFPGEAVGAGRFGNPLDGTPTTYVNCEFDEDDWDGQSWTAALRPGDPAPLNDLRNQCNALKGQGITISTVAFGPDVANPSSPNSNALRDCASPKLDGSGPQFYLVSNYSELSAVFTEIGVTLGKLRITQ